MASFSRILILVWATLFMITGADNSCQDDTDCQYEGCGDGTDGECWNDTCENDDIECPGRLVANTDNEGTTATFTGNSCGEDGDCAYCGTHQSCWNNVCYQSDFSACLDRSATDATNEVNVDTSCNVNEDCDSPYICDLYDSWQCVDPTGMSGNSETHKGNSCQDDTDCQYEGCGDGTDGECWNGTCEDQNLNECPDRSATDATNGGANEDCVLGATVTAADCTSACGTLTQSITTPATGSGTCSPGSYACQPGEGDCQGPCWSDGDCGPACSCDRNQKTNRSLRRLLFARPAGLCSC